jgi:hypothetical protein
MSGQTSGQKRDAGLRSGEPEGAELEALMREMEPVVPEGLEARVVELLRSRQRAGRPVFWRRVLLVRAAAVALIAVGFWLGARLGSGICGGAAARREQMLSGAQVEEVM